MPLAAAKEVVSMKNYLKQSLSTYAKLSKESFALSEDQRKSLLAVAPSAQDHTFQFYFGRNDQGALQRACVVVPQEGKEGPISVGVCFSSAGLVESVDYLAFGEDRGRAALQDSFVSQFTGKATDAAFNIGKDINAVAGATKTSLAVAEAIRKASFAFNTFVKGK